jgi:hypothetical protein
MAVAVMAVVAATGAAEGILVEGIVASVALAWAHTDLVAHTSAARMSAV